MALELPTGTPTWLIPRAERIPALIVGVDGDVDGDGIANLVDLCADVADPAQLDSDGDGLSDPCDTDDDNDWLLDVYETGTGIFVDETDTGSDPLNPDSDGDGATDGEEVALGLDPNPPQPPQTLIPALPGLALAVLTALLACTGSRMRAALAPAAVIARNANAP